MNRHAPAVLFSFLLIASVAVAQPKPDDRTNAVHLVGNGEVAAQLSAGGARERITGRVSFHAVLTGDQVTVGGFNVAFFGVPQKMLAGGAPVAEPLGVLAFGVARDKPQTLRYDPQKRTISGTLRMFADASFLSLLARPEGDGKGDLVETPEIPATATIAMSLGGDTAEGRREGRTISTSLDFSVKTESIRVRSFVLPAYEVRLSDQPTLDLDVGGIFIFEPGSRLCVQPVRLVRLKMTFFSWVVQYTGTGLAFGQPAASSQWAKADVGFTYRDWKTLFTPQFFVLAEVEEPSLLAQVEDDDCIEVFFIQDFDPEDAHGGGVTFGAGKASSQIISSDANAKYGIDFTHLGHELGHVLGLRHPGTSPTASAVPGSSGTLICPSGFKNDNPHFNSQENADLLSNPLLTYTLKAITPGPDCLDSPDCGPCP